MAHNQRARTLWRFSLAQLLFVFSIASLGFATFVVPNGLLAALWQIVTFGMLGFAVVASVYREREYRAFWIGFAILGWTFVATDQFGVFRSTGAARILIQNGLMKGFDDFYRPQAAESAKSKIDRGEASFSSLNPQADLANQTRADLQNIEKWITNNVFCALALLVALAGGNSGRWLYLTKQSTAKNEGDG